MLCWLTLLFLIGPEDCLFIGQGFRIQAFVWYDFSSDKIESEARETRNRQHPTQLLSLLAHVFLERLSFRRVSSYQMAAT